MTPSAQAAFPSVDRTFERLASDGAIPGVVYGVVVGGQLVDGRGFGSLRPGVSSVPDLDSVFRIASMTKSFTAAAVLLLRDTGRLRLDDPLERWLPDVVTNGPSDDDGPITIEHLLTMSAGFPTDDPWGDRQQGLDLASFADLLRRGIRTAWLPGTRFDYSNLGYGILGRIISSASGLEYRDFVREALLEPLGMDATTFERDTVPVERLAIGSVRRDDAWLEEPIDGYGALAAMGGVFTSIRDLSRWVAGFIDAFVPGDAAVSPHPLNRATRREMQQARRAIPIELDQSAMTARPNLVASGYGYGLFVFDDPVVGPTVGHGGGYPGFGSHMRWHLASGVGVIAFGNARYARLTTPVVDSLRSLVRGGAGRDGRLRAWPETLAARIVVERLLVQWDDAAAEVLFSMNIELDEPLARRRVTFDGLRQAHGPLSADPMEKPRSDSPSHLAWWLDGERGRVFVEMLLDPQDPPRVQSLTVRSVPEPPAGLTDIARRLISLCSTPGPVWPVDIELASGVDPTAVGRELRATEALFGPLELGRPIAGDGQTSATWDATGSRGTITLELRTEPPADMLAQVRFRPHRSGSRYSRPRSAPRGGSRSP